MQEFMYKHPLFVIGRQMVEMLRQDFYHITGLSVQSQLPDAGKTPDSGSGPGGSAETPETEDVFSTYVREADFCDNCVQHQLYVLGFLPLHSIALFLFSFAKPHRLSIIQDLNL